MFKLIQVRCYTSFKEAAFLRTQINALNLASARPDPFSTFEYYETYFQTCELRSPAHPYFLSAFEDDQLIGYLALKQIKLDVFGFKICKLEFLAMSHGECPRVVAKPSQITAVTDSFYMFIFSHKKDWSVLDLGHQEINSSLYPLPSDINLTGYRLQTRRVVDNSTIFMQWDTLHDYLTAASQKFRYNVRRHIRHLLAAGDVELLSSNDPATTPILFKLYRRIEVFSWKSRANTNIGRDPKNIQFYKALLEPHQPMRVSIHVLLLNQVPVAGLILGHFWRSLYALQIVFDERFRKLGPGSAMMLIGVRYAIHNRCEFFNLLTGYTYYKSRWLARITETRSVKIYRLASTLALVNMVANDIWFGILAVLRKDTWLFNPRRRAARTFGVFEEALKFGRLRRPDFSLPHADPTDQQEIAELVKIARRGTGEFLSHIQLAKVFDIQRGSRKTSKQSK